MSGAHIRRSKSMTIFELNASFPHGFHDALLHGYSVDLIGRSARLELELCVGDSRSNVSAEREAYRRAVVHLAGVDYFIVDPPDARYERAAPWMIDLCDDSPLYSGIETPNAARMYSSTTNSSIHFSAVHARVTYPDAELA